MPSNQECYRILNIDPSVSPKELRQAYLTLVKRWHPDAAHNQNDPRASEKFQEIHAAYEQLKQYLENGTTEPTPSNNSPSKSTRSVSTKISAEMLYESASELGKKGLYKDAIAELSQAIRIDPNYVLAYRYRGHLNSMLGLEYQAEADFSKAHILETRGSSRNVAELEKNAREYASHQVRGPYGKRRDGIQYQGKGSMGIWAIAGVIVAGIIGFSLFQGSTVQSPQRNQQPLNINSDPI